MYKHKQEGMYETFDLISREEVLVPLPQCTSTVVGELLVHAVLEVCGAV